MDNVESLNLSICLRMVSRKRAVNILYRANVLNEICSKVFSIAGKQFLRRTVTSHSFMFKHFGHVGSGDAFLRFRLREFREPIANGQQV